MALIAGAAALALAGSPLFAQENPDSGSTPNPQVASIGGDTTNEVENAVRHHGDGVAAIVNDSVISHYDLRQRVNLFIATSGIQVTPEVKKKISEQVLKQLETERLQLLEANKNRVSVSSSEVDDAINNILKSNGLSKDGLAKLFAEHGVHMATFRGQIAAQIAWSKTVQERFGDRVNVTPEDVTFEMKRLSQGADKAHFLVSEIFQSVDNPEQDAKVQSDMNEVESQLQQGAPFQAVARQFSQNPTAAKGGDLGWVEDGQLLPELNAAVEKLRVGEITPPIRAAGGYYILLLRNRQEPAGTKIPEHQESKYPPGVLPLARLLLPIGPTPSKALLQNATKAAEALRTQINGCGQLQELAGKLPGTVYMNLGTMHLKDLSSQIQSEVAKIGAGEATPPFRSQAGIEIMVRCDKAAPKIVAFQMPSRQQVEQQLFEERISTMSRQYMRDLRRDADIETR
jgi:peptidyl-prolyl cis-trans isomerase SurA